MKTYAGLITIGAEHIDTIRKHAGMVGQSMIMVQVLTDFVAELKFDREKLQANNYSLQVTHTEATYRGQLLQGDTIKVQGIVWITGQYTLNFQVTYLKGEKKVTVMRSAMSLIHTPTSQMVKLPGHVLMAIGTDVPNPILLQPIATSDS